MPPLEEGNFITDLVQTNPPGTDKVSQGDDHIRLIKKILLGTFPNLSGAVVLTQDEMNGLADTLVGSIVMYPGLTIPAGYLLCDGAELVRTEYVELYSAIGTQFGEGDGATTFNLPDMTDKVAAGTSVDNITGSEGGENNRVLSIEELPAHGHTGSANSVGNHNHSMTYGTGGFANGASGLCLVTNAGSGSHTEYSTSNGGHSHGVTVNSAGESAPVDMRQKTLYIPHIIKV